MSHRLITTVAVLAALALAAPVRAGQRHGGATVGGGHAIAPPASSVGRAIPRSGVPVRPPIVGPYRSFGHYPYPYYGFPFSRFGPRRYYAYPGYFALGYPWYGYPYAGYGYRYGYPYYDYGYGNPGSVTGAPGPPYGWVQIQNAPPDARVFVDGDYIGIIDEVDAAGAGLNLDAGTHRIELRAAGFEPVAFDVNVEVGRTITYRAGIRPSQP